MSAYDIVLHGATGFTGRLTAHCLAHHADSGRFTWAVAGRNADKLAQLRDALAATGTEPGVIVTQAADESSAAAMVEHATVVLNTAGPFSLYHADNIVAACARSGTHYADLSGEYWFQRRMIDEFHAEAEKTGTAIVFGAGVDSIPSDLGTQLAIEELAARGGRAAHVKSLFTAYAGSFSGGTSLAMETRKKMRESDVYDADFHSDPYVLAPGAERHSPEETVAGWDSFRFDRDLLRFGGPFFMAPINARIVRRSLALDGHLPCTYEEGIATTAWIRAGWLYVSRGFGYLVGDPIPLRPKSGEGPPSWLQRAGSFRVLVHATTEDRAGSARVEVSGAGDPGYRATSKMLTEVGHTLLEPDAVRRAGVLTPATAISPALRRRLSEAERGQFMRFRVASGSERIVKKQRRRLG
jgi:short subunit dehydrogenase-like uncharacterized protein